MKTQPATGISEIFGCEVCGGSTLEPVLDLGLQPLCDDLVPLGSPEVAPRYPLQLVCCPTCITVHQRFQVEKTLLFPPAYHYRSRLTQNVVDGMRDLVAMAERTLGPLSGRRVLDVGCNDGTLLGVFRAKGAITTGVEPTDAAHEARSAGHDVEVGFFSEEEARRYVARRPRPDIITFTNVFAHIEDLDDVLEGLRLLCHDTTAIIIENHYLGAVIERNQFDTFYHEHPRTYSFRSFQYIAERLDRTIERVEFPERYNGNIRVVLTTNQGAADARIDETQFLDGLRQLGGYVDRRKDEVSQTLRSLAARHGPLPAKAFPGRISVLLNHFGIGADLIEAAYEQSRSPKIGHYIPGGRIPILDEVDLFNGPRRQVLVNFAWHIKDEIHGYLRRNGYEGEILEIYS